MIAWNILLVQAWNDYRIDPWGRPVLPVHSHRIVGDLCNVFLKNVLVNGSLMINNSNEGIYSIFTFVAPVKLGSSHLEGGSFCNLPHHQSVTSICRKSNLAETGNDVSINIFRIIT